jgi:hypothetical protein
MTISKMLSQNRGKLDAPSTFMHDLPELKSIGKLFKHGLSSQIRIQISLILRMTKHIHRHNITAIVLKVR